VNGAPPRRRAHLWLPRWIAYLLGVGSLFSGAALLAYILAGFSLPLTLALTGTLLGGTLASIWLKLDPEARVEMRRLIWRGLLIGLVSTFAYDGSRAVLAQLDPSGFDPFAALPIFGALLVGRAADPALVMSAGIGFHLLNGTFFGLAYVFLFGRQATATLRRALLTGVVWGLFLESFQLTLYPGWLNIATYREFVTISFLGHVVYGLSLGLLSRRLLARLDATAGAADG
jgi:uncharacterized membrane protein YagU involved in acid resistance